MKSHELSRTPAQRLELLRECLGESYPHPLYAVDNPLCCALAEVVGSLYRMAQLNNSEEQIEKWVAEGLIQHPATSFVIQRCNYPDWYAGKNPQGNPIWTSSLKDACSIKSSELAWALSELKEHKVCAWEAGCVS